MSGIFGDMFDFDCDGEMDTFETVSEIAFLQEMLDEDEKNTTIEPAVFLER